MSECEEWEGAHLDDVGVAQLAEELDLADGRHVESILELSDLDLCARERVGVSLRRTEVGGGGEG